MTSIASLISGFAAKTASKPKAAFCDTLDLGVATGEELGWTGDETSLDSVSGPHKSPPQLLQKWEPRGASAPHVGQVSGASGCPQFPQNCWPGFTRA